MLTPAPEMMPLKVAVVLGAAAILLLPAPRVIALVIVLVAVSNNAPPAIVMALVDKLEPLAPPELTAKVPALMVVVPV